MSLIEELKVLLAEIDSMIDRYDSGGDDPDRTLGEVFEMRAAQGPLLEEGVRLTSAGLERFPLQAELLSRRGWLRAHIVTPDGEYPEIEAAEEDLRLLLSASPNSLSGAFELLETMYTFSGMEDRDVAAVASDLGDRTERLLVAYRALQIDALIDADDEVTARQVLADSERSFPDAPLISAARDRLGNDGA